MGLLNPLQSEIVVVGGTDDDDARLNSVEIFNVDTGVWREGELAVFEYPINGDLGNMFNVELYTVWLRMIELEIELIWRCLSEIRNTYPELAEQHT